MKKLILLFSLTFCSILFGQEQYNFKYQNKLGKKNINLSFKLNEEKWIKSKLNINNIEIYTIENKTDSINIKFNVYDISKIIIPNTCDSKNEKIALIRFNTFFGEYDLKKENATFINSPSNEVSKYIYNTEEYYFISYNFFYENIMVSVKVTQGEKDNEDIGCQIQKELDIAFFNSKIQFIKNE